MGSVAVTTTTLGIHVPIPSGMVPITGRTPIGDHCADGHVVTGVCVQTVPGK